ncbi:MAG: hypothetical protein WCB04_13920 [Mycobacteriales bacterium]
MSSSTSVEHRTPTATSTPASRWEPWTGIAFPILFVASIGASNPPADTASDKTWIANYTGHANDAGHLATGLLLVCAGLSLASFLTALWRRIRNAAPARSFSPLPIVAAAASAACISAGGVVMATVAGGELFGKYPLPGVDILRLSNDLGFALVSVGGMTAAALAIACLSVQGRTAGILGRKTSILGVVVAAVLLAAVTFIPIIAALLWAPVVAVQWLRAA